VIPGMVTAGVYGLAGGPETGKSLWCRDILCWLGGQGGVYAISEG
jgi:hypothetical protein